MSDRAGPAGPAGDAERDRTATWSGQAYAAGSSHHRSYDDRFLDRVRPRPSDVVVDLGCGSGEFSARLAGIVTDGRVIGVEPDGSMLAAARRHVAPNLEFVQAPAETFDRSVPPSSADLVVSRAMLHWVPIASYPDVFRAVRHVLEPGGWFHSESGGAGNVARLTALLDDVAEQFGLPVLPAFPDAGTVLDLVEEADLEIPAEGVRTVAQRRAFSADEIVRFLRSQGPLVALMRDAPEQHRPEIVDAVLSQVERLRRSDGTFDQTFVRLEILARRPEE